MFTGRSAHHIAALFLCTGVLTSRAETPIADHESTLAKINKICVESFAGEPTLSAQARGSVIAAIFSLGRFTVTENCATADATLKGSVFERQDQRFRAEGEGAGIAGSGGVASGTRSGFSAVAGSVATGSDETLASSETRRSASVTMRITDKNGDILWAYTQESPGGKARSALVDAVERGILQLRKTLDRPAAAKARTP